MTNKMTRDLNGLFTNENENETTYEAPRFKQSPTELWESYTTRSIAGGAVFDALIHDSVGMSFTDRNGAIPLISAIELQHAATMAGVREARVANMIAIATHKEYFNKGTVATAYAEISDYINGNPEQVAKDALLHKLVTGLPAFNN